MKHSRRDFLTTSMQTASAFPLLLPGIDSSLLNALLPQGSKRPRTELLDKETMDFWTSRVRKPSEDFDKGIISKDVSADIPEFIFYDKKDGFIPATFIKESALFDSGGVKVSFRVQGFRPSKLNVDKFNNLQSGSLRVDVRQTVPLPGLAEVLAWTAGAAFLPTSDGKLPALQNLGFKPEESWGKSQQIPLTNGLGFWSWNVFLKKKESVWGRLLRAVAVANKQVFPFLGLPAIAVTALTTVDKIVGYMQAQDASNWIFKSVENAFYATKDAKAKVGNGIALKSGEYIVVPRNQLSEFGKQISSLEMKQGYVVRKGTSDFDVYQNALIEMPLIDYISIRVMVGKG